VKWFDKWFAKQAKKAWEASQQESSILTVANGNGLMRGPDRIGADGINMKLHVANGGYIVEFHRYDNIKDRGLKLTHVINDTENLGERLSEVIVQYILSNR